MSKKITRRHMLKFVGGSAAGVLLTPIPWKTLDDLAIWTQSGPWIPKPPRGEIRARFSTCTLCPAACGVRARCVGSQPVSLSGTPSHPLSRGTLCPIGLGGHHLAYHPARLLQPVRIDRGRDNTEPVSVPTDAALGAIVSVATELRANSTQKIAVLDQVPGRTMSRVYRRFAGSLGGLYLAQDADPCGSDASTGMLPEGWDSTGFDLADAATLLSFGAPLLDGWAAPGFVAGMAGARDGGGQRKLRIIQVESRRSRTAAAADLWLPINPGTEAALALGLAHVLLRDQLVDDKPVRAAASDFERPEGASYKDLVQQYTPEKVAVITGVAADNVVALARELAQRSPAIAIGGGDPAAGPLGEAEERAICGLNLLLGSFGRKGGIVRISPMVRYGSCCSIPRARAARYPGTCSRRSWRRRTVSWLRSLRCSPEMRCALSS
jgi:anaerobic selenocysteine-containing dehydrogenase